MFIWVILSCYLLALVILYVPLMRRIRGEAGDMVSRGLSQEEINQHVRDNGPEWMRALVQGMVVLGTVIAAFACVVGWLVTK